MTETGSSLESASKARRKGLVISNLVISKRKKALAAKPTTLLMAITIAAAGMSGCAKNINHRGWIADNDLVAEIIPGVDDTSSVEASLGTPSAKSVFGNDETWYYISRTHQHVAFFRPDVTEQQIVLVAFDDRGTVEDVSELGLEDARLIDTVDKKTPTRGKELGFFEQIFSNIGRFSGGGGPAQPGQ